MINPKIKVIFSRPFVTISMTGIEKNIPTFIVYAEVSMLIIGEKLNSSIPSVKALMDARDMNGLIQLIQKQTDAGADYLDINTALCQDELDQMKTILALILEHTSCGIMLDSPNPQVILSCLPLCQNRPVIVNSVTPTDRFDELVPALVQTYKTVGLVALPIQAKEKENLDAFIQKLTDAGLEKERIYMDLLVESIATNDGAGKRILDTLTHLKTNHPAIKTTCGLSNISFGLPSRPVLNTTFVAMVAALGLDSAILDPLSPTMSKTLAAIRLFQGEDEYCM
ncbi:MAG TPA: hypothetical protein DER23_06375, partial [Clostridiales bacterium]|nr:hypothetical protein [Clostridiales bacterium]